jgi:hypothetical protein
MPDKERLQVFDAIMAYGIYGAKTEIGGLAQMALNFVFNDIDDCKKKRNEKTEKARESANKRWQKANADECERIRTNANAYERKQTDATQCYNVNVNVNGNVNEDVNVKSPLNPPKGESINQEKELDFAENEKKEKGCAKKETKHKYGEYQNVKLTDEEFAKLKNKYGDDAEKIINYFDAQIEMKGYKYKSHYLAILDWGAKAFYEQKKRSVRAPDTSERDNRNLDGIW